MTTLFEVILDFAERSQGLSEELHDFAGLVPTEPLGDVAADRGRRFAEAVAESVMLGNDVPLTKCDYFDAQRIRQAPALEILEGGDGHARGTDKLRATGKPAAASSTGRVPTDTRGLARRRWHGSTAPRCP